MEIGCQVWPLSSAAMKYCHHRQKQLWDNVSPGARPLSRTQLSRFSSVIPSPLSTLQYLEPGLTSKLYRNLTGWPPPPMNISLSHLSCFWRAALIPDLCLFSRNLYFRFYRRKLMSILHIVKTGKKNRGSKYRCLYYIFTQLTSERTRTSRIEPVASVSWKIHDMLLSFFLWAIIQFTLTPIKWMFHSSFVT